MSNCKQFLSNQLFVFFVADFHKKDNNELISLIYTIFFIKQFITSFDLIDPFNTLAFLNNNIACYILSKTNKSFFSNKYLNNKFMSIIINSRTATKSIINHIQVQALEKFLNITILINPGHMFSFVFNIRKT